MEQTQTSSANSSTRLDWLIFLVSLVGMLALLKWEDRFFWVLLPFVLTYLVKALKMM